MRIFKVSSRFSCFLKRKKNFDFEFNGKPSKTNFLFNNFRPLRSMLKRHSSREAAANLQQTNKKADPAEILR